MAPCACSPESVAHMSRLLSEFFPNSGLALFVGCYTSTLLLHVVLSSWYPSNYSCTVFSSGFCFTHVQAHTYATSAFRLLRAPTEESCVWHLLPRRRSCFQHNFALTECLDFPRCPACRRAFRTDTAVLPTSAGPRASDASGVCERVSGSPECTQPRFSLTNRATQLSRPSHF